MRITDKDIESRADRILAGNVELIESCWLRAGHEGMGRRFVEVAEIDRPDGLVAFAFRPHPWHELPEPHALDEARVLVVLRLIEGTAVRSIPRPEDP